MATTIIAGSPRMCPYRAKIAQDAAGSRADRVRAPRSPTSLESHSFVRLSTRGQNMPVLPATFTEVERLALRLPEFTGAHADHEALRTAAEKLPYLPPDVARARMSQLDQDQLMYVKSLYSYILAALVGSRVSYRATGMGAALEGVDLSGAMHADDSALDSDSDGDAEPTSEHICKPTIGAEPQPESSDIDIENDAKEDMKKEDMKEPGPAKEDMKKEDMKEPGIEPDAAAVNHIPATVGVPLMEASRMLKMPLTIVYNDCVLSNIRAPDGTPWRSAVKVSEQLPRLEDFSLRLRLFAADTPEGRCEHNFFVLHFLHELLGEEMGVHVEALRQLLASEPVSEALATLESIVSGDPHSAAAADPALADAVSGVVRSLDLARFNKHMAALAVLLDKFESVLRDMFTPEAVDPILFFNCLRGYVGGIRPEHNVVFDGVAGHDTPGEQNQFPGGSGAQSSVPPMIDAILGIKHDPDSQAKIGASAAETESNKHIFNVFHEFRKAMPLKDREFLAEIEQDSLNIGDFAHKLLAACQAVGLSSGSGPDPSSSDLARSSIERQRSVSEDREDNAVCDTELETRSTSASSSSAPTAGACPFAKQAKQTSSAGTTSTDKADGGDHRIPQELAQLAAIHKAATTTLYRWRGQHVNVLVSKFILDFIPGGHDAASPPDFVLYLRQQQRHNSIARCPLHAFALRGHSSSAQKTSS